jgi:hypothetical protein
MLFAISFSIFPWVCKPTAGILTRLPGGAGWSGSMLVAIHYVGFVVTWLKWIFCVFVQYHCNENYDLSAHRFMIEIICFIVYFLVIGNIVTREYIILFLALKTKEIWL